MKRVHVKATKHPVPIQGKKRRIRDGRDVHAIHPDTPVQVSWTSYYAARVRAGELKIVDEPNIESE